MSSALNMALYQLGWFACVLGAARGYPWTGMFAALALAAVHLGLARDRGPEVRLMLWAGLAGTLVDSAHGWLGMVRFHSGYVAEWLAPPWISVMWLQFATLFHFTLGWLSGRYLLSAAAGLVGGPLAFYAGHKLGAAAFPRGLAPTLVYLGLVWAGATPLLVWLADRFPSRAAGYRWP